MIGILGNICDLNNDGVLSPSEQALEFMILDDLSRDDESDDSDWDED